MKIWGRANSIVQKDLWLADECGLRYDRIDVGGPYGGNDQRWYLDMNPNGVVPTVEDEGLILWESNSILRYLAAKYAPGTLWPTDPAERSKAVDGLAAHHAARRHAHRLLRPRQDAGGRARYAGGHRDGR